ncbi:ABC transporter substrate-binding protein [Rhizobium leguminosarum]|uniref:ABC transporter substrate-binding protein n=1 Tax=Rhizobium leguminosarum TaxID=384 RepID=UPI003F97C33C
MMTSPHIFMTKEEGFIITRRPLQQGGRRQAREEDGLGRDSVWRSPRPGSGVTQLFRRMGEEPNMRMPITSRRAILKLALASTALSLPSVPAFAKSVTIDFWDMMWGAAEYPVAAQALVDKYNAEHPDVQVVYRSVPWTNWYETFVTAIASGSAPDLSTGAGFQAVQLYDQGAIMPVDEVIAQLDPNDFAAGALEALKYDGHYVGLPWAIDTRVLFYRKDMLEAAGVAVPTTWAEFRKAAKALTGGGKYGLVSSGDPQGLHWILATAINNGGGLFDAEGKPALTADRTKEAIQFLADLVADGSVSPASVGYVNDDARGAFFRGEAAFLLNGPLLPDQAGDVKDLIGIVPPLKAPNGNVGTINWVNNIMVYKQTEHPAETMAFLRWWSDNALQLWSKGFAGNLPARKSIAADNYFQGNPNVKYVLDKYIPVSKPMSATAGGTFPQLNEIDGDGFLMSLIQSIWQGQPVGDNLAAAQSHLEEIMAD